MEIMLSLLRCLGIHVTPSNQGTRIIDLPEDLILKILSPLEDMKDVVNFSVATKQWTHLPCCLYAIGFGWNMVPVDGDTHLFVKRVNQFLKYYVKVRNKLSMSPSLQAFRIYFGLDKHYSADIDNWILIALRNGATEFNIYLEPPESEECIIPDNELYIFPWQLLHEYCSRLQKLRLRSCIFQCRLTSTWTSLEVIELSDTPFTEYDLDRTLHCFPILRKLVLIFCRVPAKLTFASRSLTNLKLIHCPDIKEVEVLNSIALKKFTYDGNLVPLKLIDAPKLTNLAFGIDGTDVQNYVFQNLLQDFPLMTSLSIFRETMTPMQLTCFHGRMSSFVPLQELKLYHRPDCGFSIETMKEILKACPILRTLEMIPTCTLEVDAENDIDSHAPYLHKCLTFIKISGFCGSQGNVELAKFLVQVSKVLQHVIIQQKIEVRQYLFSRHSAAWHGDGVPESIKDILINLTRSQRFTFSRGKSYFGYSGGVRI